MPAVQHADAVGADEGAAVALARVQYLLLHDGALVGLLAEAGRYNNERAYFFLLGQILHVLRAELGSHHHDGQISGRQFLGIVEHLDALHLVFLRVDDAQRSLVASAQQIANDGAAWFVNIV